MEIRLFVCHLQQRSLNVRINDVNVGFVAVHEGREGGQRESVLCDSASSIARMTHIEASRTIMLAVNRFDVRYHIIYVAFL